MIHLHIVCSTKEEAVSVAKKLIEENLITDVDLRTGMHRLMIENGLPILKEKFEITAKTKSLLFNEIDQQLRLTCGKNLPEIYSTPILQMDWEQVNDMTKSVRNI